VRWKWPSVMLFVAAWAWAGPCWAESPWVESYEAAAFCPDPTGFEHELRKRLSGPTAGQGQLRVRVEARGEGFAGTIERVGVSPDLGTREVTHESCEQVVQALALIGALWLAPDANPRNEAAAPAPADRPQAAAPPPPTTTEPSRVRRFAHGPAFGLAAQALVAPDVRIGTRLGYRVSLKHRYSESELSLAWTRLKSGTLVIERDASATLTYNAGQLRLCEAFELVRSLWFAPCASFDFGALRGTGTVTNAGSVARSGLWLSAGVAGKLEWRIQPPLFIEGSAGVIYPLARPAFHFAQPGADPSLRVIFSVPASPGFSGDLLLGLRFP